MCVCVRVAYRGSWSSRGVARVGGRELVVVVVRVVGSDGVAAVSDPFGGASAGGAGGTNDGGWGVDAVTSTLRAATGPSVNGREAREAAAPAAPSAGVLRRRWGRIGLGVGAMVLGAWIFTALYLSAGDRTEVLAVADRVPRLEVIQRSDLRVVRLPGDSEVDSVAADRLDEILGRSAAVELVPGSLLVEGQLLSAGSQLLGADEAVIGVLLGPGEGPAGLLRRGTPVLVVVRPPAGSPGDPAAVEGWVFDASGEGLNARERPLEVAVPQSEAQQLSAAAADRRVSIVALAE